MDKKAMFLKAVARLQNAISIEDTKTRLNTFPPDCAGRLQTED